MTAAGKRLERAVRISRELQRLRGQVDDVLVAIRELEQDARHELRDARAEVLAEETRPVAVGVGL